MGVVVEHALGDPGALGAVVGHALGDLGALGVPVSLLMAGGAAAIAGLAALLTARTAGGQTGPVAVPTRDLPAPVRRALDSRAFRRVLRALAFLGLVAVVVIAAAGSPVPERNPAPQLLLVVFWGGLTVASLVFGPVWRTCNPLRLLSLGLARAVGDPDEATARPLPPGIGIWPAVAALAAFSLMEQVFPPRPTAVLVFLVVYAVAQLTAALRYGQAWFARGDAFEVYSSLLARLAPLGRGADGRLVLRNPLSALSGYTAQPGTLAFLALLVGASLFDAVAQTAWWHESGAAGVGNRGLALAACAVVAGLALRLAVVRPFLLPALLPLAAGYALSHHLAPLLSDAVTSLAQLGDPLDRGWDLFRLGSRRVTGLSLAPAAGAAIQLATLLIGHLLAVAAAHRMSVARFDLRAARALQFPLRVVLSVSVVGLIALQAAAG